MAERHSEFAREANDHYVEPDWCVDALLDRIPELGAGLHDPCCGFGTIPLTARKRGILATGADLVDRASGAWPVIDFRFDQSRYRNVVMNPPFNIAREIIMHALNLAEERVAAIAQAKFLFSQARHALFARASMESVLIFSRRPSMPTGTMLAELGEACRGGGSMDYCWCVWDVRKTRPGATIEWVA